MSDQKIETNKQTVENPDTFSVVFHNHEGNEAGKLIIRPNKPIRFEGDVEESAEMFFEHLKEKIDHYILDNKI